MYENLEDETSNAEAMLNVPELTQATLDALKNELKINKEIALVAVYTKNSVKPVLGTGTGVKEEPNTKELTFQAIQGRPSGVIRAKTNPTYIVYYIGGVARVFCWP